MKRAGVALALAGLLLAGCATTINDVRGGPGAKLDPWENWNRKVFSFNEALDEKVLKPVATAYSNLVPELLQGATNLGFMILPNYRGWVVFASLIVCFGTWFLIERTRLGSYLRAGTENPALVQAFGVNVPLMVMLTYAFGAGLAAIAGVLAAPVIQITPLMGSNLIIVVFAVVVIGGMGSILGSILTGLVLGLIEGLTKVFYPEASNIVVFVIMAIVLIIRPAGLFGKER